MFALFRKDRQLSDLHKDLSLDEKTMPHVYDIVTLPKIPSGMHVGLTTTFSKIAVHTKQHRIHIPMQTRTQ